MLESKQFASKADRKFIYYNKKQETITLTNHSTLPGYKKLTYSEILSLIYDRLPNSPPKDEAQINETIQILHAFCKQKEKKSSGQKLFTGIFSAFSSSLSLETKEILEDNKLPHIYVLRIIEKILPNPSASEENRSIALIDHDINLDEKISKKLPSILYDLFQGKFTRQIIKNLSSAIQIKVKDEEKAAAYIKQLDEVLIAKNLQIGFEVGGKNFLKFFSNSDVFSALFKLNSETCDPKIIQTFIHLIKDLQKTL